MKVAEQTSKSGHYEKYLEVFDEQLARGIIEPIRGKFNKNDHVWIPHRPVIKECDLTTTKIRPVFNASMKSGNAPSLNEAAYPGINLLNDLCDLLLYFRTKYYTIVGDIERTFHQIKLKTELDKN